MCVIIIGEVTAWNSDLSTLAGVQLFSSPMERCWNAELLKLLSFWTLPIIQCLSNMCVYIYIYI